MSTSEAPSAQTHQSETRKLVTLEHIVDIRPIDGADAIESVAVRGWHVVAKKGEFQVGDPCLYFEIDAALPLADPRFAFLGSRKTTTLPDGKVVHVLKTAKMRGVYSQGLALPLGRFPEVEGLSANVDLAALLQVEKYEPPIPAVLAAKRVGEFPTELARKTDAERVQNLTEIWPTIVAAGPWYATEKIDGTSVTIINHAGTLRVCGRNFELEDGVNVYWKLARAIEADRLLEPGEVLQGEIFGEGVQANPLKIRGQRVGVFGFFRQRRYVPREAWPAWLLPYAVPIYNDLALPSTIDAAIAQVDGIMSMVNPSQISEGVVWVRRAPEPLEALEYRGGFKVLSNKYLLKYGA